MFYILVSVPLLFAAFVFAAVGVGVMGYALAPIRKD